MKNYLHIAIDGPSGSRKSVLSKYLAEKYKLFCVDSGSLYRFATFYLINYCNISHGEISKENLKFLNKIELKENGDIFFDGELVDPANLKLPEVIQNVSCFAMQGILRDEINNIIYAAINEKSAVVNGRDIGSVVLPNAQIKIFMNISMEQRIEWWKQMLQNQYGYVPEEKLQNLINITTLRDSMDISRSISPLTCAAGSIIVDLDKETIDTSVGRIDTAIENWIANNENRPILSICIPTYNRGTVIKECLEELIKYQSPELEFVIIDDASEDNTAEIVKGFEDPRISFYRNEINGGASYNSHLSFLRAKGKYALLISDEDDLIEIEINKLLKVFTNQPDIAVYIAGGIRGENDIKQFPDKEYTDGFAALKELGYCTRYMTGIIFNTDMYRKTIGDVSFNDAPKVFSVYSFMYAMVKLFFCGRVITSSAMIYKENRFTTTTLTNNPKDAPDIFYFEPRGREMQIVCSVNSLSQLSISKQQKLLMLWKIYYDTADVSLRAFDKEYLPRYRQIIPDYYTSFIEHVSKTNARETVENLYITLTNTAETAGICCKDELENAVIIDDAVKYLVYTRKNKLEKMLRKIEDKYQDSEAPHN